MILSTVNFIGESMVLSFRCCYTVKGFTLTDEKTEKSGGRATATGKTAEKYRNKAVKGFTLTAGLNAYSLSDSKREREQPETVRATGERNRNRRA